MKNVNATIRNGRVHLKSFPDSKFARVDRRAKPISEEYNYEAVIMTSKQPRIGRFDDLPKLYEKNGACLSRVQYCKNICTTIHVCKYPKNQQRCWKLCSLYNFEFIEHKQITVQDLWKDGIHFANSVKVFLARNFTDRPNKFFCNSWSRNPGTEL